MIGEKVEKMYRDMVYKRADDTGCVFYFSSDDFEGLHKIPFAFQSSLGHKLQGYFYHYDNYIEGRLVIFEHGMGSGHSGYMKEIELLARHGYLVFTYDHTGCMESGGGTTNGFAQSLRDLNDAVTALKQSEEYGNMNLSVMGHSWGGFSTLNITALHPDISHVVAMAGFSSVERIIRQNFSGLLGFFFKRIYGIEANANPEFIKYDAVTTLKHTKAKVLVLHSEDDKTVSFDKHFKAMETAAAGRENVRFVMVTGKGHNPNYTADAVDYKDRFFAEYQKMLRKKQLETEDKKAKFKASYDWEKMTQQDDSIWNMIFETLDS